MFLFQFRFNPVVFNLFSIVLSWISKRRILHTGYLSARKEIEYYKAEKSKTYKEGMSSCLMPSDHFFLSIS